MKEVILNEKKYIKASEIAKHLGYTSDYVGQLCRSGKVDAELVGRSWYVEEHSMIKHRKNRYRSNQAKSKKAVQQYHAQSQTKISAQQTLRTTTHLKVHTYEQDDTELIPGKSTTTSESLSAQPAPEHTVRVTTERSKRHFKPEKRRQVQFAGSVQIANLDSEVSKSAASKEATTTQLQRTKKKKVRHVQISADEIDGQSTIAIPVHSDVQQKYVAAPRYRSFLAVSTLLLVLICIGVGILFLQTEIVATATKTTTSLHIDIGTIISNIGL